jgi:predicted dehydrogenase
MKQLLIIGAGQLGSRHLQGLLKLSGTNNLYVVDPFEEALSVAATRATEIHHNHFIFFKKSLDELPNTFDLVIVATNSLVREKITFQLLSDFEIRFLILEKVLFPNLEAYKNISDVLQMNGTPCWVNHPRRMFHHYQQIKEKLAANEPIVFQAIGRNWGLGCNSLHLLDIFTYLDGSAVQSINVDLLDNAIQESKRAGYIEFTGTLNGVFSSGNAFQITSWRGDFSPLTVTVFQSANRFIVQEGGAVQVLHLAQGENYKTQTLPFDSKYQSDLTTTIALNLFETDNCDLPKYEEARMVHEPFLKALLKKYNQITNRESHICPIT